MSNFNFKRYRIIILLCIFIIILSVIFGVVIPVVKPKRSSGPVGRTGRPLNPSEVSSYKDRKALEAYEKRNAEFDSWIEDDEIPDHNNAALLYYQALLLRPDHDQTIINKFYDVYEGAEPDTQIRTFLGQWLPSMKISDIASRIPQCAWEVWPERVWPEEKTSRIFLMKSFRHFSFIIAVDAITLASDGHYKAALERCMTLRRIARHLSHDPQLNLLSSTCDDIALRTIQEILGDMPLDADNLTWLQGRLAIFQEATPFLERKLHEYQKSYKDMAQSSSVVMLRGMLLKMVDDEKEKENIRNLTDEQIRSRAGEEIQRLINSIFEIINSEMTYEKKRGEIKILLSNLTESDKKNQLKKIPNEIGEEIDSLMNSEMTKEQKLSEIDKIINKSKDEDAIEFLQSVSNSLKISIDIETIFKSEMTEKQKQVEIKKLADKIQQTESEAMAMLTMSFAGMEGMIDPLFKSQVEHEAHINGIKAAVEIYLILAKTGKLPEELPDYLPKDPFTSRDFVYEITDQGFALHSQGEEFLNNQFLEFKIKK